MSGAISRRMPCKFAEILQFTGGEPIQEDQVGLNLARGIFVLSDGFGGSSGRAASDRAVESVRQFMEQEAGDLDATLPFELRPYFSLAGNILLNAISFANQAVLKLNANQPWEQSGGASLIAGYLEGRLLSIGMVGACSLFLKRDHLVKRIGTPKTLLSQVNPFADGGEGDSIPLMSLGTARRLEPEIVEFELKEGDQLLFHSSGVRQTERDALLGIPSPSEISQIIDNLKVSARANASYLWLGF